MWKKCAQNALLMYKQTSYKRRDLKRAPHME